MLLFQVNTDRISLKHSSMRHIEGGWPKVCVCAQRDKSPHIFC